MPKVARFTVVPDSDGGKELGAAAASSDVHFQDISAPDIDRRAHAVLTFRVNPKGTTPVTLRMRIQNASGNTEVVNWSFDTAPQRGWQEILPPGALAAMGNELIVSASGPGSLSIYDVVIWYQADIQS